MKQICKKGETWGDQEYDSMRLEEVSRLTLNEIMKYDKVRAKLNSSCHGYVKEFIPRTCSLKLLL
jgi:hypothetical protein